MVEFKVMRLLLRINLILSARSARASECEIVKRTRPAASIYVVCQHD